MNAPLFRHEVIEAKRDRLEGNVVAAVPPSSRLYTFLVASVVAIMVAILTFGSYATTARVRGIVAYDTGIARVYPSAAAEIRQFHVRNGEVVRAGQPLVTLSLAQGVDGVGSQLEQLTNQDAELARQLELATQASAAEAAALDQQRAGLAASISSLERQRTLASDQVNLAQSAVRRATGLARQGAGSQRQVEDARSTLLARRTDVESLGERLIAQRAALRNAEAQGAQRQIEASRTRSVLLAQRASLAEQRAGLMRTDRLQLTAPIAGEVSDIGIEVGQHARTDQSLVTIIPRNSRLEIWLYAPSRAVGMTQVGQRVRVLFDAFPYQQYGAGRGTVTEVSRVPTEPSNLDPGLGIQEPVFRIRVRIVLETRSLGQVLFGPIFGSAGQ
jgi:membrane fusion protein